MLFFLCVFFFFSSRRRHTSWNCDWSSDVCSSDLVRNGRIAAIARTEELRGAAGPGVRVIDADGATVTPGFTDAHIHFLPWALSLDQPDLDGAATRADA